MPRSTVCAIVVGGLASGLLGGCYEPAAPSRLHPALVGAYDADSVAHYAVNGALPTQATAGQHLCVHLPDLALTDVLVLSHSLTFTAKSDSVVMDFFVERWNCRNGIAVAPVYDTARYQVRRFYRQAADNLFIHHFAPIGSWPPHVEVARLEAIGIIRGELFRYRRRGETRLLVTAPP